MTATTLIKLIETFELKSVGHPTLRGAMIASFGIDYNKNPMYLEVEQYIGKCMAYDEITGEWY